MTKQTQNLYLGIFLLILVISSINVIHVMSIHTPVKADVVEITPTPTPIRKATPTPVPSSAPNSLQQMRHGIPPSSWYISRFSH